MRILQHQVLNIQVLSDKTDTHLQLHIPFDDSLIDENIVITDVPPREPSSSSVLDVFLNDVNISAKFRRYINEAVTYANTKVEMNTHEILSLSSILVLIPNSYSTKMVEAFGLDVLESIHKEYTPKLSLQLDIEIENVYRNVVKACLNGSRDNGIKLLCTNIIQKNELMSNFGFLILDLIRSLLTEIKLRKFDGSRTKQPDFVVSVNYQSRATNVIYVGEVTGPSEKTNVYKYCLDLIRVGIFNEGLC
ncbi:hypothetical protein C1646_682536 [Rhizophagus diaphanus]|nr:hypothetical protein C1646_682536 [Rhizophagus diaphanus] [Rhizophagus sp. MUCL 43196]